MTIIFLLILQLASPDFPTFKVLGEFKTKAACEATIHDFVTDNNIPKDKAAALNCLPVVTSKLLET